MSGIKIVKELLAQQEGVMVMGGNKVKKCVGGGWRMDAIQRPNGYLGSPVIGGEGPGKAELLRIGGEQVRGQAKKNLGKEIGGTHSVSAKASDKTSGKVEEGASQARSKSSDPQASDIDGEEGQPSLAHQKRGSDTKLEEQREKKVRIGGLLAADEEKEAGSNRKNPSSGSVKGQKENVGSKEKNERLGRGQRRAREGAGQKEGALAMRVKEEGRERRKNAQKRRAEEQHMYWSWPSAGATRSKKKKKGQSGLVAEEEDMNGNDAEKDKRPKDRVAESLKGGKRETAKQVGEVVVEKRGVTEGNGREECPLKGGDLGTDEDWKQGGGAPAVLPKGRRKENEKEQKEAVRIQKVVGRPSCKRRAIKLTPPAPSLVNHGRESRPKRAPKKAVVQQEKEPPPKKLFLLVPLSKEEIDADFLAISGHRCPSRKRKPRLPSQMALALGTALSHPNWQYY